MELVMPKLGLTMTQATLSRWLKREGEAVHQGEIIFEFESEKATMEYEAPETGKLARVLVPAGETVLCGTPVAVLETGAVLLAPRQADEEAGYGRREAGGEEAGYGRREARSGGDRFIASSPPRFIGSPVIATPAAKRRARELGLDLGLLSGRGPGGRIHLSDVEEARRRGKDEAKRRGKEEARRRGEEEANLIASSPLPFIEATPVARKLAEDLGVDLSRVQGTGPGGRVSREDVVAAARQTFKAAKTLKIADERPVYARVEPLRGVRAVIARRMSESAFTAPHVTLHTEADATALVEARRQINEELAGGPAGAVKVSYNALLVALAARALREHPALNACLIEDELRVYEAVNVALAVDTERGLLVPVIRDADRLDLVTIQRTGDELIQRAVTGRSLPDDFAGGTFTLTNLGMFEVDGFTPIINQPQAAILGVGRIASKPVDVGGEIKLRQMMTLSLSFDHRIVDGAGAARFVQRVKQLVERPFALVMSLRST